MFAGHITRESCVFGTHAETLVWNGVVKQYDDLIAIHSSISIIVLSHRELGMCNLMSHQQNSGLKFFYAVNLSENHLSSEIRLYTVK